MNNELLKFSKESPSNEKNFATTVSNRNNVNVTFHPRKISKYEYDEIMAMLQLFAAQAFKYFRLMMKRITLLQPEKFVVYFFI